MKCVHLTIHQLPCPKLGNCFLYYKYQGSRGDTTWNTQSRNSFKKTINLISPSRNGLEPGTPSTHRTNRNKAVIKKYLQQRVSGQLMWHHLGIISKGDQKRSANSIHQHHIFASTIRQSFFLLYSCP